MSLACVQSNIGKTKLIFSASFSTHVWDGLVDAPAVDKGAVCAQIVDESNPPVLW